MAAVGRTRWDVQGLGGLSRRGWYLVSPNHQSWADILVLQKVFRGHIPFLKFFLKAELIGCPSLGSPGGHSTSRSSSAASRAAAATSRPPAVRARSSS